MTREDRRTQLLDAAQRLLLERGTGGVTMERLAEYAGVSKALPYSHFENSDEVLIAVHQRVVNELGRRIIEALEASSPSDDRVAIVVETFFATVGALGPVLGIVTAAGSRAAELADADQQIGSRFAADLLGHYFGVDVKRRRAAAPLVVATLAAAAAAWAQRQAPRRDLEQVAIDMLRTIVD